jgi:hypothetical protein
MLCIDLVEAVRAWPDRLNYFFDAAVGVNPPIWIPNDGHAEEVS